MATLDSWEQLDVSFLTDESVAYIKSVIEFWKLLPEQLSMPFPAVALTSELCNLHGKEQKEAYIKGVLLARTLSAGMYCFAKLKYLLNQYLVAIRERDAYLIYGSLRSVIELAASIRHLVTIVEAADRECKDRYEKAEAFDRALIKFVWGNRAGLLTQLAEATGNWSPSDDDVHDWTATNALTLIKHAEKDPRCTGIQEAYDECCEVVHHNAGSNMLITSFSPKRFVIEPFSDATVERAVEKTVKSFKKYFEYVALRYNELPTTFCDEESVRAMFREETVLGDDVLRKQVPLRNNVENMKIQRNAPCPCGSGLKAKKCCHREC